jgi:hypothetical protein
MKRAVILGVLLASLPHTTFAQPGAGPAKAAPPAVAVAETPAPQARALVVHVAPIVTRPGEPVELEAMIDTPYVESLSVRWRPLGETNWRDVAFERSSAGGWYASIPPSGGLGVEYYIRGKDGGGAEVEHFASERSPHIVRADPTLFDRLEALDRERLKGRVNELSIDMIAHNFGNRYGVKDRFIRTEAVYSYKLLRQLHEIGFGFGSITGHTPESEMPTTGDVLRGMRYGFGQVRMRAHPSVFLDARVGLGVSHYDFEASGRGAITFGKPWRSCVQLGAEYIGDLGPTAWVRLQWDTAPPLKMGASVVRTDLPGAIIDPAGLYIAYDVAYEVVDRFTMRAQLSYGARDGAAHVGGGLGTAVAF